MNNLVIRRNIVIFPPAIIVHGVEGILIVALTLAVILGLVG